MSETNAKQATDQDRDIGARIAALRIANGMSQSALGKSLGVSFQQVQKYEKGRNRIGAGRLRVVADVLGVPVSTLFAAEGEAASEADDTLSMLGVEGAASLVRAYASIGSEQVRKDVLALVRSAARLAADRKVVPATA